MNRALLEKLANDCSDIVEPIKFGDRTFYFIKKEADADNLRFEYVELIGKKKIDKVIAHMIDDASFRNFMLVNLQAIFQYLRKNRKYACMLAKQDENQDIYQITTSGYIGLVSSPIPESVAGSLDAQTIDFIMELTNEFKKEISLVRFGKRNKSERINSDTELVDQVRKLKEIGDFSRDEILLTTKAALVRNSFNEEKTRAFFSAWQLNIFFELFVAAFIKKYLNAEIYTNRKLCILPSIGYEHVNGYLEIDVLAYDAKNNKMILVECKNGTISEPEISKFIGRTEMIESTYEIKIEKKVIIGTKHRDWFFKPLDRDLSILDIRCFDNRDYRDATCYKNFAKLLQAD